MECTGGARLIVLAGVLLISTGAQVIEFESGGLKYLTQTKQGVTVMFAHLPSQVRDYSILQVAVSNGSAKPWSLRPQDFRWERSDGRTIPAAAPKLVIAELLDRASRNDVIKLVTAYEAGLYGMARGSSTNGYEQRRQAFFSEGGPGRIKAAAAASAIAFVETKLPPGASTDGALFYPTEGKGLGPGRLLVDVAGTVFEFRAEPGAP